MEVQEWCEMKKKKKNEREGKDQTSFRDQTNFNSYGLS